MRFLPYCPFLYLQYAHHIVEF